MAHPTDQDEKQDPPPVPQPRRPGNLWKKGQSGNPGGRPKGIASAIREKTNDFNEIIDFWVAAVKGDYPTARFADRVRCSELLIERGAGKVPDVSVTLGEGVDPSVTLTGDDLEALARVARLGFLAKGHEVVDAELVDASSSAPLATQEATPEAPSSSNPSEPLPKDS